ncbi:MAG: hypothetical protein ACRC11_19805 [Xenococcaceae cyanobacterium]
MNRFRILLNAIENPETQNRTLEICDRIAELEEKGFASGEIECLWEELEGLGAKIFETN